MNTRWGNGGGHGRRITDYEDRPVGVVSKRDGEHRGRRAVTGAAAGAALGHAPSAAVLAEMRGEINEARDAYNSAPPMDGVPKGPKVGNFVQNYHPKILQRATHDPVWRKAVGVTAATGAVAGALSTGRKHDPPRTVIEHRYPKRRPKAADIGKAARYFDADARRQRRAGMYQAGLAGGGVIAAGLGAHGIRNSTKTVRAISKPGRVLTHPKVAAVAEVGKPGTPGHKPYQAAQKAKYSSKPGGTHPEVQHLLSARKRDVALAGAGVSSIAGAGLVRQKAEGRKFGIWR